MTEEELYEKVLDFSFSGSEEQYGAIHLVESMSYFMREECGSTKDVSQNDGGWIKTRCNSCREKIKDI